VSDLGSSAVKGEQLSCTGERDQIASVNFSEPATERLGQGGLPDASHASNANTPSVSVDQLLLQLSHFCLPAHEDRRMVSEFWEEALR